MAVCLQAKARAIKELINYEKIHIDCFFIIVGCMLFLSGIWIYFQKNWIRWILVKARVHPVTKNII